MSSYGTDVDSSEIASPVSGARLCNLRPTKDYEGYLPVLLGACSPLRVDSFGA